MTTDDLIEKVKILELRPGQLLVVQLKPETTKEQEEAVGRSLELLNEMYNVVVMTDRTGIVEKYIIVEESK